MPLPLQILLWIVGAIVALILLAVTVIFLLICLRVGVFVKADKRSLSVYITLGALKIKVYPLKLPKRKFKPKKYTAEKLRRLEERDAERERKKQLKKAKKKKPVQAEKKEPAQPKEKKKITREQWGEAYGSAKEILPQIPPVILDVARIFQFLILKSFKGLHVKVAKIHITVGSNDVAVTAFLYTGIVAALNPLLMFIKKEAHLHGIRHADIYITPNYLAEETDFEIALGFSMRPIRLLFIGVRIFFKMIAILIRRHKLILDLVKLIQIFIEDEEKKTDEGDKKKSDSENGEPTETKENKKEQV